MLRSTQFIYGNKSTSLGFCTYIVLNIVGLQVYIQFPRSSEKHFHRDSRSKLMYFLTNRTDANCTDWVLRDYRISSLCTVIQLPFHD